MDTKVFIQQLDSILETYDRYSQQSNHNDLSDLSKPDRQALVTRASAAVDRIAGKNSAYSKEITRIISQNPALHRHTSSVMGVVQALRDDLGDGYLKSLTEVVHGDIFADFLEMASHLLDQGYKDAAAVITGSTLESHLKKLADKYGIGTTDAKGKPKKAEKLNADLRKEEIYGKLEQKNITAWLDLRNNAAHGNYGEYTKEQVELQISGIRNFIAQNAA